MNKGSKYSRGEALFFLNAGDKLRDKEFVKLISHFQKYKKKYRSNFVLCGTHVYTKEYPGFKYLEQISFLFLVGSHLINQC